MKKRSELEVVHKKGKNLVLGAENLGHSAVSQMPHRERSDAAARGQKGIGQKPLPSACGRPEIIKKVTYLICGGMGVDWEKEKRG